MARRSTKNCVRIAWECGFAWGSAQATSDPAVPPDRDLVVLDLTEAQADAALTLLPETWWTAWSRGWVAGQADRTVDGAGHG